MAHNVLIEAAPVLEPSPVPSLEPLKPGPVLEPIWNEKSDAILIREKTKRATNENIISVIGKECPGNTFTDGSIDERWAILQRRYKFGDGLTQELQDLFSIFFQATRPLQDGTKNSNQVALNSQEGDGGLAAAIESSCSRATRARDKSWQSIVPVRMHGSLGSPLPLVSTHANTTIPPTSGSTSPAASNQGETRYIVTCDNCGRTLSGQHALSNLTRHKRSKACQPANPSTGLQCGDCPKTYQRSDALRNHRPKRHRAPPS